MAFTPVEEAQSNSVVPWGMVEKVARDFSREGLVVRPCTTMLSEGLGEVVVLMEGVGVLEEEEVTLEEVAEMVKMTPVGEVEDLTILERISRTNVVTRKLDMVRLP